MTETMRETRGKVIMEWYEKKLNRDELLKVLSGIESMKEKKGEIMREFYKNYEQARKEEGYQKATEKVKEIYSTKSKISRNQEEIEENEKKGEKVIKSIDEELLSITKVAMELENGGILKRIKYINANRKRDELEAEKEKIKAEKRKLEEEKRKLEKELKEKKKEYGPKVEIKIERKRISEYKGSNVENVPTMKEYRERYQKMIVDKKEYNKKLMEELKELDFGVSEKEKEKILKELEIELKKEIENIERGSEVVEKANEIEKWLVENWKTKMEKILELKREINDLANKIHENQEKQKGKDPIELGKIKLEGAPLYNRKIELEKEYGSEIIEINNKLKLYMGIEINPSTEIVVETRDERQERLEREKIERERKEKSKIPEELKDLRKKWEEEIKLDKDIKEKIINAVNKIPHRSKIESDGSRRVEFELGGKKYQCLDVNLAEHSNSEYIDSFPHDWQTKGTVKYRGMRGNDTGKRKNRELAEYVEEKESEGYKIPAVEFQKELINELGEKAGLSEEGDKIAMRMYLTGNYGRYRLTMGNYEQSLDTEPYTRYRWQDRDRVSSRSALTCNEHYRHFEYDDDYDAFKAGLCLIACE